MDSYKGTGKDYMKDKIKGKDKNTGKNKIDTYNS